MQQCGRAVRLRESVGRIGAIVLLAWAVGGRGVAVAQAQPTPPAPPAPPPLWAGSVGAGMALTSGNADTSNVNLTVKVTHDPRNPHLATADALYLYGSSEGEITVRRLAFNVRDEYTWTDRTSFYGQLGYLRDTKKAIEYLVAPTAGLVYKLINLAPTKLNIDAGGGVVWERNTGLDTDTSGALTLGQSFSHQLTDTASLTQSLKGLWKTADFGDTLYTVSIGLAASITQRLQLKVEFLELYKSQPPPDIEKGDLSFLSSVVYSF